MRTLRLTQLFVAIVTREDVQHGKPAPDLDLRAATMLGVEPQHCLAVDDAADGITAAREAGMRVLTLDDERLTWPEPATAIRTDAERKAATR
jgi:HAD superfamily hydrolase (TIGR01509 family)